MALSISPALKQIAPQTGLAFRLQKSELLHIVAVTAEQVADLALFDAADTRDRFSPGRTIDYNESITLKPGDMLYSNRGTPLAQIVEDTVGIHDMLLTPCSRAMFERRGELAHPSCHQNLYENLARFGILSDDVDATVNVFMNVRIDAAGHVTIHPPKSRPGDRFSLRAARDLIVGLSACSSEFTNNGSCKPIAFAVDEHQ